ncbi:hypothetical protein AB1046_19210 [Promicromonospora sp. Populi]|uniref:hypothetical protein n=1 Tax=Promicromonospora sp. Populi TaxID=3239420 RepID=UPI0034E19EA5
MTTDNTQIMRWIARPGLLSPTTVVQFYDHCGTGRVLQPLPSARVELTTAWTDNTQYGEACGDCLSVSFPWGISYTPTLPNVNKLWAYRNYTTNTVTTDQFTITSTGTMATWSIGKFTETPVLNQPIYPTITMTNELTKLIIHSGDRSHSFAPDALPKKSVTIS